MTMFNDALSTFTAQMTMAATGRVGYRDAPYQMPGALFDEFYARSWIAKAVVERIPEDCFKKSYNWVGTPEQVNAIEEVERQFKIKEKKKRALTLARLDGEAYIYFDTGERPDTELDINRITRGKLRFVNVLRKTEVAAGPIVTDPMSPIYEWPEYYEVAGSSTMVRIHPSRMVKFIRNRNPKSGAGTSDLVAIAPTIFAAETARDNVVALTTEARIDVLSVEGLMAAVQDPVQEAQMIKRYTLAREMKATNKMLVLDKEGEEYSQKSSSFATLPDVIETMRREVAAAAEIPYALLFGRDGGLGSNGETELASYYDSIKTMQETDIQPACEPLDECVIRSALGSRPTEIYMEWQSLWQASDKERAEIGEKIANAAKTLVDAGIVPAEVMTESTVNAMAENGSFPGLEQNYQDWVDAGGLTEMDEQDDLPEQTESDSVTP